MFSWLKGSGLRNPISIVGAFLTTFSAVLFLVVFLADLFGLHTNPYIGIVFFLILPGFFLIGLTLVPIGAWLERRRRAVGGGASVVEWPRLDLNNPHQRRVAGLVFVLTLANIVIVSLASYRGIEYMDSVQFCGQVCHAVMKPEFMAHQDGPHSRVACVECHIGPGASWFAKSKLSGTRQVFAVALHTYSRPIPSPVQQLRPAREVCEQCHWPEKFHGDKTVALHDYSDDEKNSDQVTTLQVHVGGGNDRRGGATGIHWHTNPNNRIEYIALDEKRQVIGYVRLTDKLGNVREYRAPNVTEDQLAKGERRTMDCMDCHNRPSHPMAATAEKAVNQAMAAGEIPTSVPFVKREAVKALKAEYATQEAAEAGIAEALRGFYKANYKEQYGSQPGEFERAISSTQYLYRRNIFPEMNVKFGSYPNNIGHMDFPGCFRCHDEEHVTKDGRKITQDCDNCHKME